MSRMIESNLGELMMSPASSGVYRLWEVVWPLFLCAVFSLSFDLSYNLVGLTFIVIIVQCCFGFSYTLSKSVNLISVYFIFSLTFLGLLPWLHYSLGVTIWRSTLFPDYIYTYVNSIIFSCNFIVLISYLIFFRRKIKTSRPYKFDHSYNMNEKFFYKSSILIFLSIFGFLLAFYLNNFSINNMLFRGSFESVRDQVIESSALSLLFGMEILS